MAQSQNGWEVLDDYGGPLVVTLVPGTDVKFLGGFIPAFNTVAMYWASRWNTEIELLRQDKGCWGYNKRLIRGSSTSTSNHSSGTAGDINAVLHPLGTLTLTAAQKAKVLQIVADLRGVVRSGAFYSDRKDEMHFELVGSAQLLADVTAAIKRGDLRNTHSDLVTNPKPKPSNPAPQPTDEDVLDMDAAELRKIIQEVLVDTTRKEGMTGSGDLGRLWADPANGIGQKIESVVNKVLDERGLGTKQ